MTNVTLGAERREGTGKGVARKLRQAGKIPAVVYGRDMEPIHIAVDGHQANLLFRSIPVDNTIIELSIEGAAPLQALVREIQTHPYKGSLVHVDFLRVQAGVLVEMNVPLHLTGTPVGVREHQGILEQVIHDLPIACIPSAIPEALEVDVSALDIHDVLHVADVKVPQGVEILLPGDRTICSIAAPRVASGSESEGEAGEGEA